ncbi:MAG: hypothetical protein H6559_15330 [Lewinellaceae bacterium]|nr:hypothetical protein [Lewinellaceae bacterium]
MIENLKRIEITLELRADMEVSQYVMGKNKFMNEYRYKSIPTTYVIHYDHETYTGSFETEEFVCHQYCYIEIDKNVIKSASKNSKLKKWINRESKAGKIYQLKTLSICIFLAFVPILLRSYALDLSVLKYIFSREDSLSIYMIFDFLILAVSSVSLIYLVIFCIYTIRLFFWRVKKEKYYFILTKNSKKTGELLRLLKSDKYTIHQGILQLNQKDKIRFPLKSYPQWRIKRTPQESDVGPSYPYTLLYFEDKQNILEYGYRV